MLSKNAINSLFFSTLQKTVYFFLSNQRVKNGGFASTIFEIFLKFVAAKSKLSDAAFFSASPLQTSGHSVSA